MYTRKKVTLPAVGEFVEMSISGCGVIVESAPTYSSVDQVPMFRYNDRSEMIQPIYPQSKYSPGLGGFSRLIFSSTEESAGDEITILISSVSVQPDLNINVAAGARVTLKATFSETAGNAAAALDDFQMVSDSGRLPGAMYISARGGAVAFAFDAEPGQGGGLGYVLSDGETKKIVGINFISDFQYKAAVLDETPEISFTMEY